MADNQCKGGDLRSDSLTSWHLLHEDFEDAILADRSQVLDNVLVAESRMQSNLLVQRLDFLCEFLRHLLDGHLHLCVHVTGSVNGSVRAPTQQNTILLLIQFILNLQGMETQM